MILNSASQATTWDGSSRRHAKNDSPTWTYLGRSFGVGSTQGLFDVSFAEDITLGNAVLLDYGYTEQGYYTQSNCSTRTSSDFNLYPTSLGESLGGNVALSIYNAYGSLPNSDEIISFPVLQSNSTGTRGLLTWAASSANNQNYLSIAATDHYAPYNSTVCQITWQPTSFYVFANNTNQTIFVSPIESLQDAYNFDGNQSLRISTMASLNILAQTSASISYATLGQSLVDNWSTSNQYQQYLKSLQDDTDGDGFDPLGEYSGVESLYKQFTDASPIGALQDSIDAMIDDIILGFAATQSLDGSPDSSNFTGYATLNYAAVCIGEVKYIFLTLGINLVILIIAVEESIRTRNWRGISLFDYQDMKSVIIAASAGGTAVADDCQRKHEPGTVWEGDGSSKAVASIRVRLLKDDADHERGPVMVLAERSKLSGNGKLKGDFDDDDDDEEEEEKRGSW